jgi:adenine/guanine/hypoxanthine permease
MDSIKRHFGFDAAGTNLRTELLAGQTTFLTMAYKLIAICTWPKST